MNDENNSVVVNNDNKEKRKLITISLILVLLVAMLVWIIVLLFNSPDTDEIIDDPIIVENTFMFDYYYIYSEGDIIDEVLPNDLDDIEYSFKDSSITGITLTNEGAISGTASKSISNKYTIIGKKNGVTEESNLTIYIGTSNLIVKELEDSESDVTAYKVESNAGDPDYYLSKFDGTELSYDFYYNNNEEKDITLLFAFYIDNGYTATDSDFSIKINDVKCDYSNIKFFDSTYSNSMYLTDEIKLNNVSLKNGKNTIKISISSYLNLLKLDKFFIFI